MSDVKTIVFSIKTVITSLITVAFSPIIVVPYAKTKNDLSNSPFVQNHLMQNMPHPSKPAILESCLFHTDSYWNRLTDNRCLYVASFCDD